jgi:small subunit ribosomal protein S29
MYKVDQNSIDILDINKHVQKLYGGQLKTFGECVWLCRSPLIEAINCIKNVSPSTPSFRLVLWGQFGTGKTLTLNQIVHYGHDENFVIVHIPSGIIFIRIVSYQSIHFLFSYALDQTN